MYYVKYGKEYLHDSFDDVFLLDLTLECKDNSCGYCDFTIDTEHPLSKKLKIKDLNNPIEVYDGEPSDDTRIFAGFIYDLGEDYTLSGKVKCKGDLALLEDTIVRPYSTTKNGIGSNVNPDLNNYFEWLINQHNSQVPGNAQFTIGTNLASVLNDGGFLFRESREYPNTLDEINEKIIDPLGGHIQVYKKNGVRYIDILNDYTKSSSQILDFGENLLDYTSNENTDNFSTCIIPLGASMNETSYEYDIGYHQTEDTTVNKDKTYYILNEEGAFEAQNELKNFEYGVTYYEYMYEYDESDMSLTIKGLDTDLPEGFIAFEDYIYNTEAVSKYGMIYSTYTNSDVTTKELLAHYGVIELSQRMKPSKSLEVKAIDMHLINEDIKPLKSGEYVRVRSKAHNIDEYFLCYEINLNLNDPDKSIYMLGASYDTLTGQQSSKVSYLNEKINKQMDAVNSISEQSKITANNATYLLIKAEQATKYASEVKDAYDNGELKGDSAVTVVINSSNGTIFKDTEATTILSATVIQGNNRITTYDDLVDTFGDKAHLQWKWENPSNNLFGYISEDDRRLYDDGFKMFVTPNDFEEQVVIGCELIV